MKVLRLLTGALMLAIGVIAPKTGNALVVTWAGNGHSYEAIFQDNPSWDVARDAAASMTYNGAAGHLATFVTRSEQEFVIAALGGGAALNALWLGGYQDLSDAGYSEPYGGWKWITGETWLGVAADDPVIPRSDSGFNNFYFNGGAEGYTITWWQTGGINDYTEAPSPTLGDSIGGPARGFIVEFDTSTVPMPAALPLFASGLGGLGLLGWCRKRKAAANAA